MGGVADSCSHTHYKIHTHTHTANVRDTIITGGGADSYHADCT